MEDCELFEEVKNAESVSTVIHNARRVLKQELQARRFTLRSSNSRMVQLYMSKQMDAKGMLTNDQYDLARTLYMYLERQPLGLCGWRTRDSEDHARVDRTWLSAAASAAKRQHGCLEEWYPFTFIHESLKHSQ